MLNKKQTGTNFQKIFLFVLLSTLAPIPFYVFFYAGIAPPVVILARSVMQMTTVSRTEDIVRMGIIGFLTLIVHIFSTYLVFLLLYWPISKIRNKDLSWVVIAVLAIILAVLSLSDVYWVGDIGGELERLSLITL